MKILCIFIWIGLLFVPLSYQAQNCQENLEKALRFYRMGQPEKVASLIAPCLNSDFDRDQKIQAYRLLTIVHLFEKDSTKAEASFISMLKIDPDQYIDTTFSVDPAELLFLYKKYKTTPFAYLSFEAGLNLAYPQALAQPAGSRRSVGLADSLTTYNVRIGYQLGVQWSQVLWRRNLRLDIGACYTTYSFDHINKISTSTDGAGSRNTVRLRETQTLVQIPIKISYDFEEKSPCNFVFKPRFYPYIFTGLRLDYRLSAKMSLPDPLPAVSRINDNDILSSRYLFQVAGLIGGGVKIKAGNNYISLGLQYSFWPQNMVNKLYQNHEILYLLGHVDNDIRLSHAAIQVGFQHPIYRYKIK